MNLKVREAFESDYIGVNNLAIELHNLHVRNRPDIYADVNPLTRERFNDLLSSNNTKVFVVEDIFIRELVAYSIVTITAPAGIQILVLSRFAHIDDFCVKSAHQKKGIGRLLFEYIIGYAKSEGASSLQLVVGEFNKDAINFYEALGMSTRNRKMELIL